jgi:alpha-glucosidase (family GH31 glycosyl hydrolase)
VHVRAGSIVPVGPELEYTDEKPADPVTLYVYAGADGVFTLYDDDGDQQRLRERRLDPHPHDVGRRVQDAGHRRA